MIDIKVGDIVNFIGWIGKITGIDGHLVSVYYRNGAWGTDGIIYRNDIIAVLGVNDREYREFKAMEAMEALDE